MYDSYSMLKKNYAWDKAIRPPKSYDKKESKAMQFENLDGD